MINLVPEKTVFGTRNSVLFLRSSRGLEGESLEYLLQMTSSFFVGGNATNHPDVL